MREVSLAEAEALFAELAELVHSTGERIHLIREGEPYAVLLAPRDLDSLEATLELLGSEMAQRELHQAQEDIAAGRITSGNEMASLMGKRRRT